MPRKTPKSTWQALGMTSGLGLQMAVCVAVGLMAGKGLDRWLDTAPWLAMGGIILGFLAGLWSVWRMVRDLE